MPIEYQKWITRQDLQDNPKKFYVFGDNLRRVGMGGQAKEMRGEPNAIGIPTKCSPANYLSDFLHFPAALRAYADSFGQLTYLLYGSHTVVWPTDGIGTGLADMENQAPICWSLLQAHIAALIEIDKVINANPD